MRSFSLRTTPFEGMHPKRRVDLRMNVWYPADVTYATNCLILLLFAKKLSRNLDKNMDWSEYMEPEHAVKILPGAPGYFNDEIMKHLTKYTVLHKTIDFNFSWLEPAHSWLLCVALCLHNDAEHSRPSVRSIDAFVPANHFLARA